MKVTVIFSKLLRDKINLQQLDIDIESYREIISACINIVPNFKNIYLSLKLDKQLTIVDSNKIINKNELDFIPKSDKIYLVPTVSGGISSAFDSLGNLSAFYGQGLTYSNELLDYSIMARRIRDSSLFGKAETAFDVSQRKANRDSGELDNVEDPTTGFGSLGTMSAKGQSIPLHFGLVRTSGVLINQYVKHIQRGGVDTIRVSDYL
jgi:predicted phage tail protein